MGPLMISVVPFCVRACTRVCQNLDQLSAPSVEPVKHNEGIKIIIIINFFFCPAIAFHHCQIKK